MAQHIASISYGKDSLAMLEVIKQNGLPLDRIIHCEVWATPTIQADLPPMVEFKDKADKIIRERYGIEVERVRAAKSYEEQFYTVKGRGGRAGEIYGWPFMLGAWCNSMLKVEPLDRKNRNAIIYIGIAADEPNRYHNITETKRAPLVEFGITEKWCWDWCEENGLLSPIYTTATRGGCWFCHNQSLNQLRILRKTYPDLWTLMLKWDEDSMHEYKIDYTLSELETRFMWEDRQITFSEVMG